MEVVEERELIDTLWNVNVAGVSVKAYACSELIEIYWNPKHEIKYYDIVFYFLKSLLYHEINIIHPKNNKNRRICDNINIILPISVNDNAIVLETGGKNQ